MIVPRVAVVVVAWNRAEMLSDTLNALGRQTYPLEDLIVVDNASTDSTPEVLASHPTVTSVITMKENLGGAGGFAAGIAHAIERDADFVWIMDDDTVPRSNALEELMRVRDAYPGEPAILACRADWVDGREHPMNRPRTRPFVSRKLHQHAERVGSRQIRTASFVAILIDSRAIRAEGLPIADYFLWNDDFEYTARLLRRRVGLYVDSARVEHRTKQFGNSTADPGARFFNEVRNKIWLFTRSKGLGSVDRIVFAGRTVLRWVHLFLHSEDKSQTWEYFCQGISASIHPPRLTPEVLQGTPVSRAVELIEQKKLAENGVRDRGNKLPDFSVLLPVYSGDKPEFFLRALRSVTVDQNLRPSEVVIVCDGPIDPAIDTILRLGKQGLAYGDGFSIVDNIPLIVVRLANNRGLSHALNVGLRACSYDVVARADADDISTPQRFARQIPLMADGYRLVGSAIAEFVEDETQWELIRRMPTTHEEIRRTLVRRDPINHPTVVYRASDVESAGGYQHIHHMEDYWLFARMITNGVPSINLEEPLVAYRVGSGAYKRRGGMEMLHSEIKLQHFLWRARITNGGQYVRNLIVRGLYRLIPSQIRKNLYRMAGRLIWFR